MSIIVMAFAVLLAYIFLGTFSYYVSMIFYFLGSIFGVITYVFNWISYTIIPLDGYVKMVYYILPFLLVFAIIKTFFVRSTKS